MMETMINPQEYKKFQPPVEHIVSGKTITVRMNVFLTEIIPGIIDEVENDGQKVLALYRIEKIGNRMIQQAFAKGTPVNTIMSYYEALNVASWDIINKPNGDEY